MLDVQRYRIVVAISPHGCSAHSPDVADVRVSSTTVADAVSQMRTAIAVAVELAQLRGEQVPVPSGPGVEVQPRLAAA